MTLGHSECYRSARGASDLLPKKSTQTRGARNKRRARAHAKNNNVLDGREPRLSARAAGVPSDTQLRQSKGQT